VLGVFGVGGLNTAMTQHALQRLVALKEAV